MPAKFDPLPIYFLALVGLVALVVLSGCTTPRAAAQVEYRCKPAEAGEFVASASVVWP